VPRRHGDRLQQHQQGSRVGLRSPQGHGLHDRSLRSSEARVHSRIPLGEGCVVLPGAVIEPFVTVGANAMVWANVTLAHHCSVAEHCWIASGSVVSGQARVLRNTFVGVNATIVNAIRVAEYNIIGAAAMVSKDTKPNSVHLSRSAEPLRYSSDDYVKYFGV